MLTVFFSKKFKKDRKKLASSGKNTAKLDEIIIKLVKGIKLDVKNREHSLKGEYTGFRECHIEPDWLLIYKYEADSLVLERTGSHSELFKS